MTGRVASLALEEILVSRGLVPPGRLAAVLSERPAPRWPADRLVAAGLVSEEQVALALSDEFGYPFVAPVFGQIDADLVRQVPAAVLRAHRALPLIVSDDGTVDVAFADPHDSVAPAVIQKALERRVQPAVATSTAILSCLREVFGPAPAEAPDASDASGAPQWEASGALRLHALILSSVREGATEIHLVPEAGGGLVRRRRGGVLVDTGRLDAHLYGALTSRLRSLAGDSGTSEPARAFLKTQLAGRHVRLSVSVVPTERGDAALVAIDEEAGSNGQESPLGKAGLARLAEFLARGEGLVVLNALRLEHAAQALCDARGTGPARPEQWVWCGEGPALDVGPAVRIRADRFAGGLLEAVSAARSLAPEVLVLSPRPGGLPPPEALLSARSGRRVVLVGAWGSEEEAVAALRGVSLPAGTLESVLRFVVTLSEPARAAAVPPPVRQGGAKSRRGEGSA